MLKNFFFIFYLECILLLRRSAAWLYPLGFFVIVISLFPFAFTADPVFLQKYFPGFLWIAALLASFLSMETIFFTEQEDGHFEQLLLSNTPLTLLLSAKLTAQWLVTEVPLILLTPLLGSLFHLSLTTNIILCLSLLLGTPALICIGSFGAALTLGLRQQGVFLGLLVLPLMVPILIFGIAIMQQLQAGFSIAGPLAFLAGLSLLAITLLPPVIAATVRISLED